MDPQQRQIMAAILTNRDVAQPWARLGTTQAGRPIVFNPNERGLSTEWSITVPDPRAQGHWMNIPSLYGGRPAASEDDALARIMAAQYRDPETGRPIIGYPNIGAAEQAARERTRSLDFDPNIGRAFRVLDRPVPMPAPRKPR